MEGERPTMKTLSEESKTSRESYSMHNSLIATKCFVKH